MSFRKIYNMITYPIIAALLVVFAIGMAHQLHMNTIVFVLAYLPPFLINYYLATVKGKSVPLMMLLTFIFSWIVTLILAFVPETAKAK